MRAPKRKRKRNPRAGTYSRRCRGAAASPRGAPGRTSGSGSGISAAGAGRGGWSASRTARRRGDGGRLHATERGGAVEAPRMPRLLVGRVGTHVTLESGPQGIVNADLRDTSEGPGSACFGMVPRARPEAGRSRPQPCRTTTCSKIRLHPGAALGGDPGDPKRTGFMYRAKEASATASSLFADLPMALAGVRSRSDSGRALTRRVCECACRCASLEFDANPIL